MPVVRQNKFDHGFYGYGLCRAFGATVHMQEIVNIALQNLRAMGKATK